MKLKNGPSEMREMLSGAYGATGVKKSSVLGGVNVSRRFERKRQIKKERCTENAEMR